MLQPKTMYETIRPLLMANFVLGMGIWPTRVRWRMILSVAYSLLCMVCFSVFAKLSMTFINNHRPPKLDYFGEIMYRALFYTNFCLTWSLVISGLWKTKVMRFAYARIVTCERAVERVGIRKDYRNLYLYQIYMLGLIGLVFLTFVGIHFVIMSQDLSAPVHIQIITMFTMHYPVFLLYVADASFLYWVRYSKIRFGQLNNLLRSMLTTTPDSPQHKRVLKMRDGWSRTSVESAVAKQQNRGTNNNVDTMKIVKQIHLELVKCTRTSNEAYGIQILLSMTVSFVFITGCLYEAYTNLWLETSQEKLQELISLICWTLFYASKIFIINHMCAMASIEAASTGDIICELYEPSTTKEFRAEIRDFTLQLIQNPLIFTACGFFNLDHTFIHGVIGSVTTYLVILIQVRDITPSTNATLQYNMTDFITLDASI